MLALDLDIYLDVIFWEQFWFCLFFIFFLNCHATERLVYHDHSFFVLLFVSFLLIVAYLCKIFFNIGRKSP